MQPGSTSVRGTTRRTCSPCRSLTFGVSVCLLAVMLAMMAASCGNGGSGIKGIVTERRPIEAFVGGTPTPSLLPDGFGMSADMPAASPQTLLIKALSGSAAGQVMATVRTHDGLFKVAVPPGRYVVVIQGLNRESDQTSQPIIVQAGQYSPLVLHMFTH